MKNLLFLLFSLLATASQIVGMEELPQQECAKNEITLSSTEESAITENKDPEPSISLIYYPTGISYGHVKLELIRKICLT